VGVQKVGLSSVKVLSAMWDYPKNVAKVNVQQWVQMLGVPLVPITRPYQIIVLENKVRNIKVSWYTTSFPIFPNP
jgi:hypothetical protein